MGEMADFYLDCETGEEPLYDYSGELACRYCKRGGFHWEQTDDGKWRLVTKIGRVHQCKAYFDSKRT